MKKPEAFEGAGHGEQLAIAPPPLWQPSGNSFERSSTGTPCPVCDRTKDGDCRILSSGIVLCHTCLNGVAPGRHHPDRPFVYCGHRDEAQGFGIWKPEALCEDRKDKAPRKPQKREFTYFLWDGSPAPQQRLRIDYSDGRPKRCTWAGKLGIPQREVAPYRWHEAIDGITAGDLLFIVRGELKAELLTGRGFRSISLLNQDDERLTVELRALAAEGVVPVLVPDNDSKDLDYWYATLTAAIPEARSLLCPLKGMDWRTPPKDGGLGIEDWIARSKPSNDDILAAITEQPWGSVKPMADFMKAANSLKQRLDEGLAEIDAISDVATRSVALHTLQRDLDLSEKTFLTLVRTLSEAKAPKAAESFEDLMSQDTGSAEALAEELLPTGLLLIAAEGGVGKSSIGYQIAEAVTNGAKFAGQFKCRQAAALIIQMDESVEDAKRKWRRMGLSPSPGRLTVKWRFSPMMFPELRRWIAESDAKLVVLDSLLMIAGGQISPKDAEFGLLIYRLNELAGELGITILCLHHVIKSAGRQRTEITKDDIFGTAYIFNGAADVWGLWRTTEDGTGDTLFGLRCLKARSGLVDVGTTYEFIGNDEDRRMTFRGISGRTTTLNQIRTARDRVIALLEQSEGALLTPEQVSQRLQLGNRKYAGKLLGELYDRRSITGVDREQLPSTGGRPGYAYFVARARNAGGGKGEKSQTLSPFSPGFSHTFPPGQESSEREEREGVEGGFSPEYSLRATGSNDTADQPPRVYSCPGGSAVVLPGPANGSSWDVDGEDDPHWGPRPDPEPAEEVALPF